MRPRSAVLALLAAVTALTLAAPSGAQCPAYCSGPGVTTDPATGVQATVATLNGRVNPQDEPTAYQFEYGTTTAYGTYVAAGTFPSGAEDLPVQGMLTTLEPATTYHYRLVAAHNGSPIVYGEDRTFTTDPATPGATAPTVATGAASAITSSTATVSGTVTPGSSTTAYAFEYGTTDGYGTVTPGQTVPAGAGPTAVTADLSLLLPGTTYHYRLVAAGVEGGSALGEDRTFATAAAPGGGPGTGGPGAGGGPGATLTKVRPRLTLRARPRRDASAPFEYVASGRLRLPATLSAEAGCSGRVRITLKRGSKRVGKGTATVGPACRYARRVRAKGVGGAGRLTLRARFRGNAALLPKSAERRRVRFG